MHLGGLPWITEGIVFTPDEALPDDFLGHSVIAGPAFPRFSHVYAEASDLAEG